MAKKLVQLYYDVLSPYSWIGFETLCRYRQKWNVELRFCPFLLAGIMKGSENRPPGVVRAKARHMSKDLRRLSSYYSVPLNVISNMEETLFVKGSLSAQRLLTAIKMKSPHHLESVSRQLWLRIWSRDEDITRPESLQLACLAAGLTQQATDDLIGRIESQEVKEELKRTTQEALDLGAFGAPFIVAHIGGKKEEFFGSDRMELLAHTLGEKWEGPLVELKARL
ncbi:hypothetical protein EMCRGX_G024803 [Ephydatia muelleri]|eukprot:Em0015g966a